MKRLAQPFKAGVRHHALRSSPAGLTAVSPVAPIVAASATVSNGPRKPVDFTDTATAFKGRSSLQLARSLLIFRLCTIRPLVSHARHLVDVSNRVLGKALTSVLLRHTFFAQFCAGEDDVSIRPTLAKLSAAGIGGILDFAAEKDVADGGSGVQPPGGGGDSAKSSVPPNGGVKAASPVVHIMDAEEEELNSNLATTIQAVRAARDVGGFAAVKMTSIATPELLRHMSAMLEDHRRAFRRFNVEHVANPYLGLGVPPSVFLSTLKGPRISEDDAHDLFSLIDYTRDSAIDFTEWNDFMSLMRLGVSEARSAAQHTMYKGSPSALLSLLVPAAAVDLTENEQRKLRNVLQRADALAAAARDARVTIMVDAEQTYLQPAIDYITLNTMRKYNRPDPTAFVAPEVAHVQAVVNGAPLPPPLHVTESTVKNERHSGGVYPAVYNTYQAYRRDTPSRLELDLRRAARENFLFGAKLVRGAYMIQERKLAKEQGYNDPIHPTIEATHACYNECASMVIDLIPTRQPEIMVASHNEQSIMLAAEKLLAKQLDPATCGVSFGQLLGMCDHISFSLAAAGYKVFKYVPYGPVQAVLPYLIRRAEENSDLIKGGVGKEITMLQRELKRRMVGRA